MRLIDLRIVEQPFSGRAAQIGNGVPTHRIDEPVSLLAVQSPIAAADDVRGVSIAAVTAITAIGNLLVATATVWIPARRAAIVGESMAGPASPAAD